MVEEPKLIPKKPYLVEEEYSFAKTFGKALIAALSSLMLVGLAAILSFLTDAENVKRMFVHYPTIVAIGAPLITALSVGIQNWIKNHGK